MMVLWTWKPLPISSIDSFFHLMKRAQLYFSSFMGDSPAILSTFFALNKPSTPTTKAFHSYHERLALVISVRAIRANSKRRSFGRVTLSVADSGVVNYVHLI